MSHSIGDKLVLNDNRQGVIVYIGSIYRKKGTYYGLILTNGKGDTNGSVGIQRYEKLAFSRLGEETYVPFQCNFRIKPKQIGGSPMRQKQRTFHIFDAEKGKAFSSKNRKLNLLFSIIPKWNWKRSFSFYSFKRLGFLTFSN